MSRSRDRRERRTCFKLHMSEDGECIRMICWLVGVYMLEEIVRNASKVCIQSFLPGVNYHAPLPKSTCTCERMSFSDACEVVVLLSICMLMSAGTKMFPFQPNCSMINCISPSFSAKTAQTGPLNAWHNTTQRALSTHLYRIASSLSILHLYEKHKNRLISPVHGETRLNSCVCEVHEYRYSTDSNSASRACCLVSIGRTRDP